MDPEGEDLWGFHLDAPEAGASHDAYAFDVRGWAARPPGQGNVGRVEGRPAPAVARSARTSRGTSLRDTYPAGRRDRSGRVLHDRELAQPRPGVRDPGAGATRGHRARQPRHAARQQGAAADRLRHRPSTPDRHDAGTHGLDDPHEGARDPSRDHRLPAVRVRAPRRDVLARCDDHAHRPDQLPPPAEPHRQHRRHVVGGPRAAAAAAAEGCAPHAMAGRGCRQPDRGLLSEPDRGRLPGGCGELRILVAAVLRREVPSRPHPGDDGGALRARARGDPRP